METIAKINDGEGDRMIEQCQVSSTSAGQLEWINEQVKNRLRGRLQDFFLLEVEQGLILRGRSRTFYAKQLAQHIVMKSTDMPILANNIEVF